MKLLSRYLIVRLTVMSAYALLALLALYNFIDLLSEKTGIGNYTFWHAVQFTLLQTQLCANDRDMSAALLLLKKNRPKKKQDLLRLLTQKTPTLKAEEIVHSLQQSKQIYIDAAENVRYR